MQVAANLAALLLEAERSADSLKELEAALAMVSERASVLGVVKIRVNNCTRGKCM